VAGIKIYDFGIVTDDGKKLYVGGEVINSVGTVMTKIDGIDAGT
jgi:hypothetical protein